MTRIPDRSPASVEDVFNAIRDAVRVCGDVRVGQLIMNAVGRDPYYVENSQLAALIRSLTNDIVRERIRDDQAHE